MCNWDHTTWITNLKGQIWAWLPTGKGKKNWHHQEGEKKACIITCSVWLFSPRFQPRETANLERKCKVKIITYLILLDFLHVFKYVLKTHDTNCTETHVPLLLVHSISILSPLLRLIFHLHPLAPEDKKCIWNSFKTLRAFDFLSFYKMTLAVLWRLPTQSFFSSFFFKTNLIKNLPYKRKQL